jgi:DNA-directed RNA polymerase subunit M/transcription elongation factor TFIIS
MWMSSEDEEPAPLGSALNPIVVSSSGEPDSMYTDELLPSPTVSDSDSQWTSITESDFDWNQASPIPHLSEWKQIRYIPEKAPSVVWELDDKGRLIPDESTSQGEDNAYCYQHHFEDKVVEVNPPKGDIPPFLVRERKNQRICPRCKGERDVMVQKAFHGRRCTETYTCMNCRNKWKK